MTTRMKKSNDSDFDDDLIQSMGDNNTNTKTPSSDTDDNGMSTNVEVPKTDTAITPTTKIRKQVMYHIVYKRNCLII
jgi:hypothetical protein